MKQVLAATFGTAILLVAANGADAGLFDCLRCNDDCEECEPTCAAPVDCCCPPVQEECGCHAVATACCGMAAGCCGAGQLGMVYGMNQLNGYTGYEGLPNMDGRGVHGRYPYHSYRRPWFHPGPKSANVSIVW